MHPLRRTELTVKTALLTSFVRQGCSAPRRTGWDRFEPQRLSSAARRQHELDVVVRQRDHQQRPQCECVQVAHFRTGVLHAGA